MAVRHVTGIPVFRIPQRSAITPPRSRLMTAPEFMMETYKFNCVSNRLILTEKRPWRAYAVFNNDPAGAVVLCKDLDEE